MTLEQRLEKLERENRWMRRIGAVADQDRAPMESVVAVPPRPACHRFLPRHRRGEAL
jgi:hypothetical protein